MAIDFSLSPDGTADGRLDPDDLLGRVAMSGDHGGIVEDSVYLDDWFKAVASACARLRAGESDFEIDLADEPVALRFLRDDSGLRIEHDAQWLRFADAGRLERELVDAVGRLLALLREAVPDKSVAGLRSLEDFVAARR